MTTLFGFPVEPDIVTCLLDLATVWAFGMALYLVLDGIISDRERKNAQ